MVAMVAALASLFFFFEVWIGMAVVFSRTGALPAAFCSLWCLMLTQPGCLGRSRQRPMGLADPWNWMGWSLEGAK